MLWSIRYFLERYVCTICGDVSECRLHIGPHLGAVNQSNVLPGAAVILIEFSRGSTTSLALIFTDSMQPL